MIVKPESLASQSNPRGFCVASITSCILMADDWQFSTSRTCRHLKIFDIPPTSTTFRLRTCTARASYGNQRRGIVASISTGFPLGVESFLSLVSGVHSDDYPTAFSIAAKRKRISLHRADDMNVADQWRILGHTNGFVADLLESTIRQDLKGPSMHRSISGFVIHHQPCTINRNYCRRNW